MTILKEQLASCRTEVDSFLLSSEGFGIVVTDQELSILDCNPGFVKLFNMRRKPQGEKLTDFLDLHENDLLRNEELRLTCNPTSGLDGIFYCKLIRLEIGFLLFCDRLLLTESRVLEQMGIVNNELINLQRELAKKNKALEKMTLELAERVDQRTQKLNQVSAEQQIILETMPIGVCFLKNRTVLLANPAFDRLLGYETGATRGFDTAVFYADPDVYNQLKRDAYDLPAQGEAQHTCEVELVKKDGSKFWCCITGSTVNKEQPEDAFIWIVQDITERKQADKLLAETVDYTKLLMETVPVGVIIYKGTGETIRVNETAARIVGTTINNVEQQNFRHLESWQSSGMLEAADRALITGVSQHNEIELNTTYGNRKHVFVIFTPFMYAGEQQLMVCAIDVTEQNTLELERNKLEHLLHQSQKMEAIGQLAGGVAHDFNNKLMVIMGYVSLAKMDIHDSDNVLECLNKIRYAADLSKNIACRLLSFSRQQIVTPQVLDANKIIAETLTSLSRLIGENIPISFDALDNLWSIRMDPVQLDQVVMNMAVNARDAMPDGGAFVIETRNVSLDTGSCSSIINATPGDYVMITFHDTGTGMAKETLTHIFEPFFTTKEVDKGTGLGLAIIHGIIHQNGGFIDVTSNVGYGTEFMVYIPRFSAPLTETTHLGETICTGSGSILHVEDEDAVRIVTSQFLKKIGYTVHEAATPSVALEIARDLSLPIDLVLTDYLMPEMNGKVMMERIRELRPKLPCIYASGFSTDHALLSEEANFIQKPYDLINLSALLKRVISGSAL